MKKVVVVNKTIELSIEEVKGRSYHWYSMEYRKKKLFNTVR